MQTDEIDVTGEADANAAPKPSTSEGDDAAAEAGKDSARPERKGVLREYIESFDQQTLQETGARLLLEAVHSRARRRCSAVLLATATHLISAYCVVREHDYEERPSGIEFECFVERKW